MNTTFTVVAIAVIVVLIAVGLAVRIIKQYEQGVLFRFGRVQGARDPGLRLIIPIVDVLHRVSMRIVTMPIQSQGIITRDNVSVDVSAVAYFRVVDAVKWSVSTPWTRRCRRPTGSTRTSARSWTSPHSTGAWR
jgi:regulator of protease activity HflC (stomatin/prohibitin superfamily)